MKMQEINEQGFGHQLLILVTKLWAWLAFILFGWIGSVCHNLVKGKKMTKLQFIGSFGIAVFVGFLASSVCLLIWDNDPVKALRYGSFIVSLSACVARDIMTYIFTRDYTKILDMLFEWLKTKKS